VEMQAWFAVLPFVYQEQPDVAVHEDTQRHSAHTMTRTGVWLHRSHP
jgi:hypothetical protein